jgi:hypothetical protein
VLIQDAVMTVATLEQAMEVDIQVEELVRKDGHDHVELIKWGDSDVRNKKPEEIVHTAPSKYSRPKYLVMYQRYRRPAKKTIRKSAGILPTPKAPIGNPQILVVSMPDQPMDRPVPVLRKVLLHQDRTPINRVTGQDVLSDLNAKHVPEQIPAGV